MLLFLVVFVINCDLVLVNGYHPSDLRPKPHSFVFNTDSRIEICDKKNPGMIFSLDKAFQCMNGRLEKLKLDKLLMVESCWHDYFNMQNPKDNVALIQLYCKDANPFLFKNVVESCVIRKLVTYYGEVHFKAKSNVSAQNDDDGYSYMYELYRMLLTNIRYVSLCSETTRVYMTEWDCAVANHRSYYPRYSHIENVQEKICIHNFATFDDDYDDDDDDDDDEEDQPKQDKSAVPNKVKDIPSYCNDDSSLQENAETCLCLNTKYSSNMSQFKECWQELMPEIPLPSKEKHWRKVLCNFKLYKPLDLIANVEKCILRKVYGTKKDYFFDPDRDRACLTDYFLKNNDEPRGSGPKEEQVRSFHSLCAKKNETELQGMLRNNVAKCIVDKVYQKHSSTTGLVNYCWHRLAEAIGSKIVKVPVLDEDWLQFYCTEFDTRTIQFTFPGLHHAETCFQTLSKLPSRSYYVVIKELLVDPQMSVDEKAIDQCLSESRSRRYHSSG